MKMANPEQLTVLLLGVQAWNGWREDHPEVQPDLSGISMPEADLAAINLGGANLRGADLHGADLSGANLSGADLGAANLRGAQLRGAGLNWAYLCDADLRGADLAKAALADANLSDADLAKADLSGADLHGADLRSANLFSALVGGSNFDQVELAQTKFGDVDLSGVKGLDRVRHKAPSTIGIDTLCRSGGEIPESFLRGAGVPDHFISMPGAVQARRGSALNYLISHAMQDEHFSTRLSADLQAYGVRTYDQSSDNDPGRQFLAEILTRVKMFDGVIAVCSRHSLETKKFIKELNRAINREPQEKKRVLYAVRLDNYLMKQWENPQKQTLIEHTAADFSGWTRSLDKYETGLKTLLKVLRGNG